MFWSLKHSSLQLERWYHPPTFFVSSINTVIGGCVSSDRGHFTAAGCFESSLCPSAYLNHAATLLHFAGTNYYEEDGHFLISFFHCAYISPSNQFSAALKFNTNRHQSCAHFLCTHMAWVFDPPFLYYVVCTCTYYCIIWFQG